MPTESEDVVKRSTMEELVRTYAQAEADIRAACATIAAALDSLNAVVRLGETSGGVDFRPVHNRHLDYNQPEEALTELRRQIWRRIVDRLELRRMMSVRQAKALDDWLDAKTVETIDIATVTGLWRCHAQNLPEMLSEAIGEVYEFLRPSHSELKTNTQYELKSRVILERWVEHKGISASGFWPTSWRRPHFVALENVLSALDGRGSVSKSHYSEIERAIETHAVGETTYFHYKCYRNGNLHIEFKRPDLIKRFNTMAGGKRLKPTHGA
jgi:hypothetical protein